MEKTLFTIGHSTRTIEDFLHILKTYRISQLVDVRHYPGSRHCPQFGQDQLIQSLKNVDIDYISMIGLGGRRKRDINSLLNAEAVPWRCHRSMISDALLINDFIVWDIISENNVNPHSLTSFAKISQNNITYPE